jgi:hypothetical protein
MSASEVFLSHSTADRQFADQLAAIIRRNNPQSQRPQSGEPAIHCRCLIVYLCKIDRASLFLSVTTLGPQ